MDWRKYNSKKTALQKQKDKVLSEIEKLIGLNREFHLMGYNGFKTQGKKLFAVYTEDFVDEDTGEVVSIERSKPIPLIKEFTENDLNLVIKKFDKFS